MRGEYIEDWDREESIVQCNKCYHANTGVSLNIVRD